MSVAVENVKRDLRSRVASDRQMSLAWITVPLLQILAVAIVFVIVFAIIFSVIIARASGGNTVVDVATLLGILFAYAASSFILSIFNALMLHRLVRRRNMHFVR